MGIEIPDGGITLLDEDGIKITADKISRDSKGFIKGVDIIIENNTDVEKKVEVAPNMISSIYRVNGYTVTTYFNETVAAGKKSKATLTVDSDLVSLLGMKDIYEIIVGFETYESGDDYTKHNQKEYEPYTLSLAPFDLQPVGTEIFNEGGISIYSCGAESKTFLNHAVFCIRNDTGKDTKVYFDSMSVNGFMASSLGDSVDLYSGTCGIVDITISKDDFPDGIQDIEFAVQLRGFSEIFTLDKEDIGIAKTSY